MLTDFIWQSKEHAYGMGGQFETVFTRRTHIRATTIQPNVGGCSISVRAPFSEKLSTDAVPIGWVIA